MRVHLSLLCAFVLVAGSLFAQQQPTPGVQPDQDHPWLNHPTFKLDKNDFRIVVQLPSCPVGMRAQHAHDGALIKVRRNEDAPVDRHGQGIHLILTGPAGGQRVAHATITARGFSQRGRILTTAAGNKTPDLRRTLEVQFSPEGEGSVAAEFYLPGFSAVTSVHLDSITYADGTTWAPANAAICRVAPDPFMLVAQQ